jgi:UDP-GlcNAc:undecaprenyl-phosphate GlcNAc-1-phosphate transferase
VSAVLVAFLVAAGVSAIVTPLVRALAIRFDLLDHALTARKIHGQPIPRLGGAAIVAGFGVGLAVALAVFSIPVLRPRERILAVLAGSLIVAALGVVDDLRGANAWQKFAIQFTAAGLVYAYGVRVDSVANPFGPSLELGALGLPITLLWIVGVTNAFNLIDGLDGLAGGVATIALAVSFLIALGRGEVLLMIACAALAGAILGFLRHNFHPASIFMGDTGSMFLGFVLATLAVESHHKATTAVAIIVPITALGLPILDTLLAVVRRVAGGGHAFHADREHIHHRLLALGMTHRRAVLALYGLSLLFGAMALALNYASQTAALFIAAGLGTTVYLLLSRLGYIGSGLAMDPRPTRHAAQVRSITENLANYDRHEVWEAFCRVSRVLNADCVRLVLSETGADGETVTRRYTAGTDHDNRELFLARFRVGGDAQRESWVEFGWEQGDPSLEPETAEALRLLCQEIGEGRATRERAGVGRPAVARRW